MTNQTTDRL